jgi:glycosyltransferase involved in cell wall biosynthesis
MASTPLFSVIVPTYGRPQFLSEAVASVIDQTVDDFECIVVDDASPDRVEVVDDDRVLLVRRTDRGGAAAARNSGLEVARGSYVTFLDDDDLYKPDRLAIALRGLSVAPLALCWRNNLVDRSERPGWEDELSGNVHDLLLERPVPHVGQLAIVRELAPRFDERFHVSEDVEWWLRASMAGHVTTVPRVGYILRYHGMERLTKKGIERLQARLLLLDLHAPYFARHRRAASYQWRRVGGLATAIGDRPFARRAFGRAFVLHPRPRSMAHLLLACTRGTKF